MDAKRGKTLLAWSLSLSALGVWMTLAHAQQAGTAQPQQTGTTTAQKPLIPLAASTLANEPDRYVGENVTLAGTVDRSFSRHVFSIDQDGTKTSEKDVLVLTRTLNGSVDLNSRVTVIGEVVRFEPADIKQKAKDYPLDLAPEVAEKYRGRPAVLATNVISSSGVDLARRIPPPLTAEEAAYASVMKQVAAANTALRKAIEASDTNLAHEQATALKQAFAQTVSFWKARGKTDATTWAGDARKLVESIDAAAAGGKWDEVKASASSLGQTCQSCHGAYRERLDDGTYRIKQETK